MSRYALVRALFSGRSSRVLYCGLLAGCLSAFGQAANPGPGADQDQGASQEPTIRVNVDLVNVYFTVKTKKGGQLIPDLKKENFGVLEDGKPQTIERFSKEADLPLTLGLLIDISASQERLIEIERQAASQFFSSVIRPKDEAFLISFGKSTDLLQDYTSSPRQLSAALRDLRGDGQSSAGLYNPGPIGGSAGTPKGTLLFDAIYLASNEKLKSEVGRKALILITDGEDQGSSYKLRDAVEAAQRSDAIIYSIYYVDRQFYSHGAFMIGGGGGESGLEKMSDETGGHVFKVDSKHSLADIFKEIEEEMRNQYSLGYRSTNEDWNGSFRKLQVKVDNSDYRVQCRNGYYATRNGEQ